MCSPDTTGTSSLLAAAGVPAKPTELDRLAAAVHSTWGDVRLLINNAGVETMGNSWEIPLERWEATLNINLHGVIHGVRAFAPRMLANSRWHDR